jgi:hypothetical protein
MPNSKTPNGIAEVPLTSLAIEAFKSQMAISGEGPFLFRAGIGRRSKLLAENSSTGKDSLLSELRPSFHVCH